MEKIDLRIKALELACSITKIPDKEIILFIARDFYKFLDPGPKNITKEEKISLQEASCEQILDELQKRSNKK